MVFLLNGTALSSPSSTAVRSSTGFMMLSLLSMIFRVMVHFCSVLLPSQLFCAVPSRIVVYFVEPSVDPCDPSWLVVIDLICSSSLPYFRPLGSWSLGSGVKVNLSWPVRAGIFMSYGSFSLWSTRSNNESRHRWKYSGIDSWGVDLLDSYRAYSSDLLLLE